MDSEFFWIIFVIAWGMLGFFGWIAGELLFGKRFEFSDLMAIPGAILLGPLTWVSLYI